MSTRETFSNTISLAMIDVYDQGAAMWISIVGTFTMLLVEASSETELFKHLSDYVLAVRNLENTKSMIAIFLFKMFKI